MKLLIVGLERSGTTVIAKLLAKQSGLSLLNDPRDSWYIYPLVKIVGLRGFTYSLIRRLYRHKIVKVPGFAAILFQLRKIHFKPFKVVYVVRDPRDAYAAIKERLGVDLSGLYLNIEWLGLKGNSPEENIALRWNAYIKLALKYKKTFPNDIMFIRYEDFLLDKAGSIKNILKFSNLPIQNELTDADFNKQSNKSWSSEIKGSNRYKSDLSENEILVIETINKEEMNYFKYE